MVDDLTKSNIKPLNENYKIYGAMRSSGAVTYSPKQKLKQIKKARVDNRRKNLREGMINTAEATYKTGKAVYVGGKPVYRAIAKQFKGTGKQLNKSSQSVANTFQAKKLSASEISMRRKAMAQRMQAIQAQRKGVQQQGLEDNRWNRRIIEQQMRDDEDERRRRFIEVPDDFEARKDALRQLKVRRNREFALRSSNNILRTHEGMLKVRLDLLRTDDTCNLCKSPRIWREDNPDNNIFADTGRPTIMDTPNAFAVTPESQRWNILNTPHLNFGNVDTRRKPRRFVYRPEDQSF